MLVLLIDSTFNQSGWIWNKFILNKSTLLKIICSNIEKYLDIQISDFPSIILLNDTYNKTNQHENNTSLVKYQIDQYYEITDYSFYQKYISKRPNSRVNKKKSCKISYNYSSKIHEKILYLFIVVSASN